MSGDLADFKAQLPPLEAIVGRFVELKRRGGEWWAPCPFHADRTPSFHIVPGRGFYHCFGCGAHGDALNFMMAMEGLDFRQARERLGDLGGIAPDRSERPAKPAPRGHEREPEPEQHESLAPWGHRLWGAYRPIKPGTVAAAYLEGRGCALPPWPDETHLRWHAELVDKVSGYQGPALVGLMTDPLDPERALNLHRTWLAPDGSAKAPIDKPRRLLKGHPSRGVVRLWPDEEATLGLVIGEGIETCLAAARAGFTPTWATCTAGNLAAFPVLPGLEGLTILVDHDRPDKHGRRAGDRAALALLDRYTEAGFDPERDLVMIQPPGEGEDAADLEVAP